MKIFYFFLVFIYVILICKNLSLKHKSEDRTEENMKYTAFAIAKNYLFSFTPYKKSQVALASREKESNENNFISKFIFVEHKFNKESDQTKEFVYFRVCMPKNKSLAPYLDVFCPFSQCTDYNSFKNSKLECLKELPDGVRQKIAEENELVN